MVTFASQSQPLVAIPERTHNELPKLRNFAILANLFRRKDPRSLELRLRDVDAKGCLELFYRWRQEESSRSVKQKIARKIQQNESAFRFEDWVRELLEDV